MKKRNFLFFIVATLSFLLFTSWSYAVNVDSCQPINASGIYTLINNLVSSNGNDCIVINSNDVLLDLRGFYIGNATNDGRAAINITSVSSNVTVMNGYVNFSAEGISLRSATGVNITNVTAFNNSEAGIVITHAVNSIINNVTAYNNQFGIIIDSNGTGVNITNSIAFNNNITFNIAYNNTYAGISLKNAYGNNVSYNFV
ncbi:right-handed parallel beta-helix repeat-containing protein [Candidatus Woesearchaeota archaeon]|nr:right-handed parallel beta-helix repeat-containing protein [Candidatus Woesearchaeota archaeon]